MSLASQITLFVAAVRNKLNLMTPRLLPSGGTVGQALLKSGAGDYAAGWAAAVKAPEIATFNYTGAWQTYTVPEGAKSLQINVLGPGGNGGNGFSRAAGNPGGGGGGGGGGGITTVDVSVAKLGQSTLYVFPGAGSGGNVSYVSLASGDVSSAATLARASAGANGGNGTAAAVGAAGAAGVIATPAVQAAAQLGIAAMVAGQLGSPGGAIAGGNGTALTFGATGGLTSGGTGGGGCTTTNFSGGQIQNTGPVVSPISGGNGGGFAGISGGAYPDRFMWTGGTGGGSNNSGVGGRGGDGAVGSGGGGGGAGVTGGGGGAGGPGLVVITAFF